MSTLSLRLPESLHKRLAALAEREGISINQLITSAVAEKMAALDKKGSQDLTYLALQQQISDELLNIRFTAKAIERLCDSVRHMVEQVRSHERQILQLCVDRAGMPRQHFIKVFPGHEVDLDWLKDEIAAGKQVKPHLQVDHLAERGVEAPCRGPAREEYARRFADEVAVFANAADDDVVARVPARRGPVVPRRDGA